MKLFVNPIKKMWAELCLRPQVESALLESSVKNILEKVRKSGDEALKELTRQFDNVVIDQVQVSEQEIANAVQLVSPELKEAMQVAACNIRKFHSPPNNKEERIETIEGVLCWRKMTPVSRIGIYIPGGTAPLFSTVLMLGIPAKLAGCEEIILCTPPDENGKIDPALLYAAQFVGLTKIFKVGGAQAIGAMTYGTRSIPKVYKIFGPGNQFVTKAKELVSNEGIAIDLPAGPSELLVFADDSANAAFIAADLLSQAEHGEDSQVILVTTVKSLWDEVSTELKKQLDELPRKLIAEKAVANSRAIYFDLKEKAIEFINEYAPEHLILSTKATEADAEKIKNAGSVFLGNYSPEAAGDYASGTNHTLPTNGNAKGYSGVSLGSFMKQITFQKITKQGLQNIGFAVETMAEAEGLIGHKRAIQIRNQNSII